MDARHHPFDVLSGSALGILVAWAAYRQYFPPLTKPWHKGRAYPMRTWGAEPQRPYDGMSRGQSPVELLRMAGQPGGRDPEHGIEAAKPVRVNEGGWRSAGRGEEGVYGARGEGRGLGMEGSSTEYAHPHSAMREGGF